MARYKINCIVHDNNQVIIEVGLSASGTYKVQDVVNWILTRKHSFYTLERGVEAEVYAKRHPVSGRWFLTTEPDSLKENNLDFLSSCAV